MPKFTIIFTIVSMAIVAISANPMQDLKKQFNKYMNECGKEMGLTLFDLVPYRNEKPEFKAMRIERVTCMGRCVGKKFGVIDDSAMLIADKAKEIITDVAGSKEGVTSESIDEAINVCKASVDTVIIESQCADAFMGMMCLFQKYYPLVKADGMKPKHSDNWTTPRNEA